MDWAKESDTFVTEPSETSLAMNDNNLYRRCLCGADDVIILLRRDRLDFQPDLLSHVFNDVVDTIRYVGIQMKWNIMPEA